jgi:glycosyltransferase involved in cell wall biosynthesis
MSISVVILTFNSEAVIGATLDAASEISNDIHIVDSFSTDQTLNIAERYGARIVQRPFEDYGQQRNWAITNLPLAQAWELHLDADERLSTGLIKEIKRLVEEGFPKGIDGYFIPRLTHFLGGPIKHGGLYPIWHLRLFRRNTGRCEARLYDQHFYMSGLAGKLNHPIIDDQRNSIFEWVSRHNRWAQAEASETENQEKNNVILGKFNGSPIERKRALRSAYYRIFPLLRAFLLFMYRYFLRLGFLDGKRGLIYFVLQTFWFRFLVDAVLYERHVFTTAPPTSGSSRLAGKARPRSDSEVA